MDTLKNNEILCYLMLFVACLLSSAAGIGGGSINVSILLVIGRFNYKKAVMLSFCALFGNLLFQVIINLLKSHPLNSGRPLVYWELLLLFVPAMLGGTNIGMILSKVLSESTLLLLAASSLGIALIYSAHKSLSLYVAETKDGGSKHIMFTSNYQQADLQSFMNEFDAIDSDAFDFEEFSSIDEGELLYKNYKDPTQTRRHSKSTSTYEFSWAIILILFIVWIVYAVMYILLHMINDCKWEYYQITIGFYPILALAIYFNLKYLQHLQDTTSNVRLIGDIDFHDFPVLVCGLVFIIGILCSLLGLGGGEFLGPLMLWLKILPQTSSATTGAISLFNASSTVIYYLANQRIPLTHGVYSFLAGSFGGLTGRMIAIKLAEILGRPSILAVCLTIVIGISCFMNFYEFLASQTDFHFHNFCNHSAVM